MGKKSKKIRAIEEQVLAKFFADSEQAQQHFTADLHEPESSPWFLLEDKTAVEQQIDKYIEKRFAETKDRELVDFLKANAQFRKLVREIREDYIRTQSQRRKKAA